MHKVYRAALTLAVCLAQSALAQVNEHPLRQAGELQLHQPVEREIGPGQTDVFTVHAPAGQFMRVVALQNGVDVAVAIVAPGGKTLVENDSPNGLFGPEPASILTPASGVYQVRIACAEAPAGRYRIELSDLRKPSDSDAIRIRAEKLLPDAVARVAKKENLPEAAQQMREAASMWHQLSDSYEEALCLYELGSLAHSLDDNRKALEFEQQAIAGFRAAGDRDGEGSTLGQIGIIYFVLGEKRNALESLEKAEPLLSAARFKPTSCPSPRRLS